MRINKINHDAGEQRSTPEGWLLAKLSLIRQRFVANHWSWPGAQQGIFHISPQQRRALLSRGGSARHQPANARSAPLAPKHLLRGTPSDAAPF
jgi:hypothetical protein